MTDNKIAATNKLKFSACGKIIISGEHAVVHGAPALVIPVEREVSVSISEVSGHEIACFSPQQHELFSCGITDLEKLKQKWDSRYAEYLRGELAITKVFTTPLQLPVYTMALFYSKFKNLQPIAAHYEFSSTLKTGVCMGSSAACVVAVLRALSAQHNVELSDQQIIEMGRAAENLQHGKSSGLDVAVSHKQLPVRYKNGKITLLDDVAIELFAIHTAPRECSTGECVDSVRDFFVNDSQLVNKYAKVTEDFHQAIKSENSDQKNKKLLLAMRENHRLLCAIGVVPKKVQEFIAVLEALGGAAKITGAGAIRGDGVGTLIALDVPEVSEVIPEICARYGYTFTKVGCGYPQFA